MRARERRIERERGGEIETGGKKKSERGKKTDRKREGGQRFREKLLQVFLQKKKRKKKHNTVQKVIKWSFTDIKVQQCVIRHQN